MGHTSIYMCVYTYVCKCNINKYIYIYVYLARHKNEKSFPSSTFVNCLSSCLGMTLPTKLSQRNLNQLQCIFYAVYIFVPSLAIQVLCNYARRMQRCSGSVDTSLNQLAAIEQWNCGKWHYLRRFHIIPLSTKIAYLSIQTLYLSPLPSLKEQRQSLFEVLPSVDLCSKTCG